MCDTRLLHYCLMLIIKFGLLEDVTKANCFRNTLTFNAYILLAIKFYRFFSFYLTNDIVLETIPILVILY